jgi:hypothetical protein
MLPDFDARSMIASLEDGQREPNARPVRHCDRAGALRFRSALGAAQKRTDALQPSTVIRIELLCRANHALNFPQPFRGFGTATRGK